MRMNHAEFVKYVTNSSDSSVTLFEGNKLIIDKIVTVIFIN